MVTINLLPLISLVFHIIPVFTVLTRSGFTVIVDDVWYFAPPTSVANIGSVNAYKAMFKSADDVIPITVVASNGSATVATTISSFGSKDDVWTQGFAKAVYYQHTGPGHASLKDYSGLYTTGYCNGSSAVPNGPYFLSTSGALYQAYRLYSDDMGAFTESVYAGPDGSFSVLPAGHPGQSIAIAVPSKLYFTPTTAKPLAGVRIGIKDLFDIAGLRTSNGNRAWYHLYPPANFTATPVQRLVDAGAIIIGKMKTSQFANGETATSDWMDYHSPFNPRGDAYQDASSSSSGPGAGVGAYAWLDAALGSDTGGSVRGPAQVQGIYGNRPSHDLVSLEHTMPLAPELDTAGLLTRDPVLWATAAKAMYGSKITFTSSYPTNILAVDFPPNITSDGDALLLGFLETVSGFLKAKVTTFDPVAAWANTSGSSVPLRSLLNLTYPTLITKEQTKLVRDPFYRDYAAAHNGRRPFIDAVPLVRWNFSDTTTETLDRAIANKTLFMNWINSTVLVPNAKTCSNNLLVYVGSEANTNYRNTYRAPPKVPMGFGDGTISNMAEVPDMVVPVGQAAYNSTITLQTEYLPVTVDFVAARGCDGMIFSLVNDLYKAGILQVALPGMSGTQGGQYLYRRYLMESR